MLSYHCRIATVQKLVQLILQVAAIPKVANVLVRTVLLVELVTNALPVTMATLIVNPVCAVWRERSETLAMEIKYPVIRSREPVSANPTSR